MVRTKEWHTGCNRVCHWCSHHILTSVIDYWTDAQQHGIYLFYIITKILFHFKISQHNAKAGLSPAFARSGEDGKKPFDVIYLISIQNEAISLVTVRTYSESRIELRHLKILKKMLEKSSPFLLSEQPCEPKSLDFALKIARVEKILLENLWLHSTEAIWFKFWMKGA